jgi:hypothetical protein
MSSSSRPSNHVRVQVQVPTLLYKQAGAIAFNSSKPVGSYIRNVVLGELGATTPLMTEAYKGQRHMISLQLTPKDHSALMKAARGKSNLSDALVALLRRGLGL